MIDAVAVVTAAYIPLPCNDYYFISVVVAPPRVPPTLGQLPTSTQLRRVSLVSEAPATAGSGGPTMSSTSGGSATADSTGGSPSLEESNQLANFIGGGLILSPAMEPIPPRLVQRIRSGQFIHMRELLSDNMALHQQWEATQGVVDVGSLPASLRPRYREVPSLISWVFCFLAYAAVRAPDEASRNLLTYCWLLIREALRHSGEGWREYDRLFRSQAAINPLVSWNTICPSLQAATLLGQRGTGGTFCTLCNGSDHTPESCALRSWQQTPFGVLPPASGSPQISTGSFTAPGRSTITSGRICASWNSGECIYPALAAIGTFVALVGWAHTEPATALIRQSIPFTGGPSRGGIHPHSHQ